MSFDKEALSPRAVPSEVVPLPFDLAWPDLAPALPTMTLSTGAKCVAKRRLELQGLRGRDRSTVITVQCRDKSGSQSADLFVKIADRSELDRYALVERAGVPVPRLLTEIPRGDEETVLVFEFLDTIGVDTRNPAEVAELLRILAELNSVPLSSHDVASLPTGRPEAEFTASVRHALLEVAGMGHERDVRVEAWLAAYSAAKRRAASMPRALTHGEFYFQQVGRRHGGPLVLFDLATLGPRPRFSDMSNVLSSLAAGTGTAESDVFHKYLRELSARGVAVPPADEAFLELRWLRVLTGFESLPWLTSNYNEPELGLAHLEEHVATLERDLIDLHALA